jgi:hypothetical protein
VDHVVEDPLVGRLVLPAEALGGAEDCLLLAGREGRVAVDDPHRVVEVDHVDRRDLLVLDPAQLGLEVRDVAVHARALLREVEDDVVLPRLDVERDAVAHVVHAVVVSTQELAGAGGGRSDQEQRKEGCGQRECCPLAGTHAGHRYKCTQAFKRHAA